ncbi:MAG TPA: hypothetical protein VKE51_41030 [Vicinamibacterales bacterium]|nr:hypothetical protein [Vicinamibacterales bacterium]
MSAQDGTPLTPREQAEYTALRATIRERGTARVLVFAVGLVGWGALAATTAAMAAAPIGSLLPLGVLAGIFEGVFALHVGVERVGRYLQVFYEGQPGERQWEHAAMDFGRPSGAASVDPLFTVVFLVADLLNLFPALALGPTSSELIFVGGAHALFVIRVLVARASARKQRSADLARFRELRERGLGARDSGLGARG